MRIENRERPEAPARAAPDAEQLSAVDDVLDHLLDPLEDVVPDPDAAERRPPPQPIVFFYEEPGGVRDFVARLRWSQRSRFRIPRLLAGWALVAALFLGALWVVFSSGALR
jgi:hypothetical protein